MSAWGHAAALTESLMSTISFVRSYRKHYALTQDELADLLALSQTAVSRLEDDPGTGSLDTALALQVLFGLQPGVVFRRLYLRVEEAVMARAARLDRKLRGKTDPDSMRKQQLLADMVDRARPADEDEA